jgi:hypothetical protein
MFHIPAHKNVAHPAAQVAINVNAKVDCHRCGGYPDVDESGRPYTCYCCGDTGRVSLASAFQEYEGGAVWAAEHPPLPPVPRREPTNWSVICEQLDDDIPF